MHAIRITSALLALLAALVLSSNASASSVLLEIGPDTGCVAECLNTTWSLEISTDGIVDPDNFNLHVTLTATWPEVGEDFVDENGVIDPTIITAVEFGIPGKALDSQITNPAVGWSTELGPLAGDGCKGNNGNFTCSEGIAAIVQGESLTWEWDLLVKDVQDVIEPEKWDDFHVGAQLENDAAVASDKVHDRGWLLSVTPPPAVPEPSAALLFTAGLLTVGYHGRRRR